MFFDYRAFQIIKKGYLQRIRSYRFIDFLLPFILICVPIMFLIAVLGVVFETFFQSKYITMGIIYYLLYLMFVITLMNYITVANQNYNNFYSFIDPFGIIYVIRVIQNVILAQFPSANVTI